MKQAYLNAIADCKRRADVCLKASKKPNTMKDCGWTDVRYKASWLKEYHKAIYRLERIKQRMKEQQFKKNLDSITYADIVEFRKTKGALK